MRRFLGLKLLMAALLAACVTVNVYFPAAAAEQAADKIIDTVTSRPSSGEPAEQTPRKESNGPTGASTTEPHGGHLTGRTERRSSADLSSTLVAAAGNLLELLVPSANAQANANIDVSSPEIRAITGSMQQRFGQLQKYFASGAVGLTSDGSVAVRDPNAVPLAERATATRLVAEDNRDRSTLYSEIAKANGHPEWEPDIRRIFARRWVERGAQPGWYYQDSSGKWVQK